MAMRHAPLVFLSLLGGALIESFAVARGAKVLAATGRLERETRKRVYETASMVRDLFLPGGLSTNGKGTEALVRVRLLHAWVRRHLRDRGFAEDSFGAPINQADMLHTLLLFSHVIIHGMARLGAQVKKEDRASWAAMWRYAGYLSGVDEQLLPKDTIEAARRSAGATTQTTTAESSPARCLRAS